jgi:hypothetical protein
MRARLQSSRLGGALAAALLAACSGRFDFDVPAETTVTGAAGATADAPSPTAEDLCIDGDEETAEIGDQEDTAEIGDQEAQEDSS